MKYVLISLVGQYPIALYRSGMELSLIEEVLDREQCKTGKFVGGVNRWSFNSPWDRDKHQEWLDKTYSSDSSCPIQYIFREEEALERTEIFAPATARTG
jgi:hypothetical protein